MLGTAADRARFRAVPGSHLTAWSKRARPAAGSPTLSAVLVAVLSLLAAAAVVWGPGLVVAAALGVPLRWALAVAPALSAGVLGGWALLEGPVTWTGAVTALLVGLLVVLVPGAVHRAHRSSTPSLSPRDLRAAVDRRRSRAPSTSAVRHRRQGLAIAAAGAVAGGGGLAAMLARAGASIGGVNQLWDAAWHANLTRLIAQGGDGSPSVAGALIGAGWRQVDSWYPTGLHVAAALVDRLGGTPAGVVPVAAALGSVVALHVLVVLPAVVAALVWELTGELRPGGAGAGVGSDAGPDERARGAGAAVAAVVATLPTAFPLDRLWSPAWPMTVAFVLALVTVLALVRCARAVRAGTMTAPAAACVVGGCLLGTGLTHPSGAVVALMVGTGWLAGRAVALRGPARWRALGAVAAGVGLAAGGTAVARDHLPSVASVFAHDYRVGDVGAALVSVAGLSAPVVAGSGYGVPQDGGQPLVGALLLAGALGCAALRGARWLATLWAVLVVAALETFVPVAAPLALVSGWFFNVESRLLAVVALVGALAVGLAVAGGASAALAWCSGAGRVIALSTPPPAVRTVPVPVPERATVRLLLTVPAAPAIAVDPAPRADLAAPADLAPRAGLAPRADRGGPPSWARPQHGARAPRSTRGSRHRLAVRRAVSGALALTVLAALVGVATSSAPRAVPRVRAAYADRVVGPDARAVMSVLAAAPLPAGGRVLNDPLDGSPWLYALTGRMPMFSHYDARHPRGDARTLLLGLDDADRDPQVRAALERMRVCYVYASDALVSASKRRPAGFEDLDGVAALQPIARSGRAVAYRVVPPPAGCAGGPAR